MCKWEEKGGKGRTKERKGKEKDMRREGKNGKEASVNKEGRGVGGREREWEKNNQVIFTQKSPMM